MKCFLIDRQPPYLEHSVTPSTHKGQCKLEALTLDLHWLVSNLPLQLYNASSHLMSFTFLGHSSGLWKNANALNPEQQYSESFHVYEEFFSLLNNTLVSFSFHPLILR